MHLFLVVMHKLPILAVDFKVLVGVWTLDDVVDSWLFSVTAN